MRQTVSLFLQAKEHPRPARSWSQQGPLQRIWEFINALCRRARASSNCSLLADRQGEHRNGQLQRAYTSSHCFVERTFAGCPRLAGSECRQKPARLSGQHAVALGCCQWSRAACRMFVGSRRAHVKVVGPRRGGWFSCWCCLSTNRGSPQKHARRF